MEALKKSMYPPPCIIFDDVLGDTQTRKIFAQSDTDASSMEQDLSDIGGTKRPLGTQGQSMQTMSNDCDSGVFIESCDCQASKAYKTMRTQMMRVKTSPQTWKSTLTELEYFCKAKIQKLMDLPQEAGGSAGFSIKFATYFGYSKRGCWSKFSIFLWTRCSQSRTTKR